MQSQRGVAYQLSTEGLWTVEERGSGESGGWVQGGGGLGAGGGGQRISKPLRGRVFLKNQVSEEFCCQIVVVLSLFCLILDLIQHHFHLLWCGLKFYQL